MEFHVSVLVSLQLYLLLFPKNRHLVLNKIFHYQWEIYVNSKVDLIVFCRGRRRRYFLLVKFVNYLHEATYYFRVCVFFGVIILLNLRESV